MLRFNSEPDESVLTKEMERKKKIEQKTKEIKTSKGSIHREKEIRLPKIRSSSSLLQTENKSNRLANKNGESPTDSGSTEPSTVKFVNRSRSTLNIHHPNIKFQKDSFNQDTPSASFMGPERGELFPIKDLDNRNEQRYCGIPNYSLVQQN